MLAFQFKLQTPDQIIFEGDSVQVTTTAFDGLLTFLADHESLVTRLEVSLLTITFEHEKVKNFVINGGLASFKNNILLINTIEAQEIDRKAPDLKLFPKAIEAKNQEVQKQIEEALKLGGYYQPDLLTTSLLAEERLAKLELLREVLRG